MKYYVNNMPLGWRHIWIVAVASSGQFIGTALATVVGVIIPMLQILSHPELSAWVQGLLGASDLIGIALGAVVIGKLTDRYGYLPFFRLCPALMLIFSVIAILIPDVTVLTISLFLTGFAIGGEYSLDSDYISELMPARWTSTMVGVAKAASALGNIVVAGVCFVLIEHWREASAWPRLMWLIAIFSSVMLLSRIYFAESPGWLLSKGRIKEAQQAVRFFLGENVSLPEEVISQSSQSTETPADKHDISLTGFIKQNPVKVILSGIPWACEGLGVYGIGIFLPVLVMALGLEHFSPHEAAILHVASSVKVTFWISCLILPGFVLGLFLMRRMSHIRMLYIGFFVSAVSLTVLALGYRLRWPAWISISAFMMFEIFLNMGPHLITYVLPPQIYPVSNRSLGSGLAASIGKIGAVVAVFVIPVILNAGGIIAVLGVSIAVMLLGGVVALVCGPKVMGRRNPDRGQNLEARR